MPDQMEEVPPITQITVAEPLAFITPDPEEAVSSLNWPLQLINLYCCFCSFCKRVKCVHQCFQAILGDLGKGKITSSGVSYNPFRKGRSTDNISGD